MRGPVATYAFINAKLRARISKILPENAFQALIQAKSLSEALMHLRDTHFAFLEDAYNRTGDIEVAELELLKLEIAQYAEIRRYLSGIPAELNDLLSLRFEIDNLKNILRIFFDRVVRKRLAGTDAHFIFYDTICNPLYPDQILNADSVEQVIKVLAATPYGTLVEPYLREIEARGSLFRVEMALDRYYYLLLVEKCGHLARRDRIVALRLTAVEIDLHNIERINRLKDFYGISAGEMAEFIIPAGIFTDARKLQQISDSSEITPVIKDILKTRMKGFSSLLASSPSEITSKLSLIDSILEQILMVEVGRILSSYPFTIGIVLAYFVLKGREMRRIRTILNAKLLNIAVDRIEAMV